ncbi:hypothetical protein DFA_05343 [Cavenderia fasciculata]|uniref:Protein kinase domain-containing protein n=1 Tax=Cavenderia fasciculata TaxID=261658 RepID=F4PKY9_CACFS|nr:uncharacterized protein DFA_05343 [Cavenderia fasciculata]EGG23211.1 hypothetical protein DFA_05343 [Cavenderia fasciculata]|eukprot:XP_004361062.1 hypothetical protein DFA_05343 [Cavenderia fasciculata]
MIDQVKTLSSWADRRGAKDEESIPNNFLLSIMYYYQFNRSITVDRTKEMNMETSVEREQKCKDYALLVEWKKNRDTQEPKHPFYNASNWVRQETLDGSLKTRHPLYDMLVYLANQYRVDYEKNPSDDTIKSLYGTTCYCLGVLHKYRWGVEEDKSNTLKYLMMAADVGEIHACYLVGMVYYFGTADPSQSKIKIGDYKPTNSSKYFKYQEYGYSDDIGSDAKIYHVIAEQNFFVARDYLFKAAQAGIKQSRNLIGRMHINGESFPQCAKKAREWHFKADEYGIFGYYKFYFQGRFVKQNYDLIIAENRQDSHAVILLKALCLDSLGKKEEAKRQVAHVNLDLPEILDLFRETYLPTIPFNSIKLDGFINQGWHGELHKIRIGDNYYALKVAKATNDPTTVTSFQKEAEISMLLTHPNVVQVHGSTIMGDNKVGIIMEFIESSLKDKLFNIDHQEWRKLVKDDFIQKEKEQSLVDSILFKILKQIITGMEYLHSQEIIHRDLKSGNILIDSNNHIKICDMGLSMVENTTKTGVQEQYDFERKLIDKSTKLDPDIFRNKEIDVIAFGIVIYDILKSLEIETGYFSELAVKCQTPYYFSNHFEDLLSMFQDDQEKQQQQQVNTKQIKNNNNTIEREKAKEMVEREKGRNYTKAAMSAYQLGMMSFRQNKVSEAFQYFNNHSLYYFPSALMASYCYSSGNGVNVNPEQAFKWCEKAYFEGSSIDLDSDEHDVYDASQLQFLKSQLERATFVLGLYYYNGKGIKKDESKALELFNKVKHTAEASRLLFKYHYSKNEMDIANQYYDSFINLFKPHYKSYYLKLIDKLRVPIDQLTTLSGGLLKDYDAHTLSQLNRINYNGSQYEFQFFKVEPNNLNVEAMIYFDIQKQSNTGHLALQRFYQFAYDQELGYLVYLKEIMLLPTLEQFLQTTTSPSPKICLSILKSLSNAMHILQEDDNLDKLMIILNPSNIYIKQVEKDKVYDVVLKNDFILSIQLNTLPQYNDFNDIDSFRPQTVESYFHMVDYVKKCCPQLDHSIDQLNESFNGMSQDLSLTFSMVTQYLGTLIQIACTNTLRDIFIECLSNQSSLWPLSRES